MKKEKYCKWVYDENEDYHNTDCDNGYYIGKGTLKDNDFIYCPFCGRKIKEIRSQNENTN